MCLALTHLLETWGFNGGPCSLQSLCRRTGVWATASLPTEHVLFCETISRSGSQYIFGRLCNSKFITVYTERASGSYPELAESSPHPPTPSHVFKTRPLPSPDLSPCLSLKEFRKSITRVSVCTKVQKRPLWSSVFTSERYGKSASRSVSVT
jgi:hypothetical protein